METQYRINKTGNRWNNRHVHSMTVVARLDKMANLQKISLVDKQHSWTTHSETDITLIRIKSKDTT